MTVGVVSQSLPRPSRPWKYTGSLPMVVTRITSLHVRPLYKKLTDGGDDDYPRTEAVTVWTSCRWGRVD